MSSAYFYSLKLPITPESPDFFNWLQFVYQSQQQTIRKTRVRT